MQLLNKKWAEVLYSSLTLWKVGKNVCLLSFLYDQYLTFKDQFTVYYECLNCLLWKNCQEFSLNTKCSVTEMICQDDLKPLPFPCSLEYSLAINQSFSECGLFTISSFLVHPNCAQTLKSCGYFQNHVCLFFLYLVSVGLTLISSQLSFWNLLLTSVTNKYAHHLPFA